MMYKTILFDFDGTVFDTVDGIAKSAQYALKKHGLYIPTERLRIFAGPPLVETFREHFGVSQEKAEQLGDAFREYYIPVGMYEATPYPGMVELINDLRGRGMTTAVTTLKPLFMAKKILEHAGLIGLFNGLYGSPDTGVEDSKEKIIARAMNALNASAEETIVIGDKRFDITGAHLVGVKAVGVRYGYAEEGELEEAGADVLVNTVCELRRFLLPE